MFDVHSTPDQVSLQDTGPVLQDPPSMSAYERLRTNTQRTKPLTSIMRDGRGARARTNAPSERASRLTPDPGQAADTAHGSGGAQPDTQQTLSQQNLPQQKCVHPLGQHTGQDNPKFTMNIAGMQSRSDGGPASDGQGDRSTTSHFAGEVPRNGSSSSMSGRVRLGASGSTREAFSQSQKVCECPQSMNTREQYIFQHIALPPDDLVSQRV